MTPKIWLKLTESKTKPSLNEYTQAMLDADFQHAKIMEAKMKVLASKKKSKTEQEKPTEPNTTVTEQMGHKTKQPGARKGSLTHILTANQRIAGFQISLKINYKIALRQLSHFK